MEETSIVVRAKAAWSLGNLSDALVLNRWVILLFVWKLINSKMDVVANDML